MVTVKLIGHLGNQLFQIAACIGYARQHKLYYCIPTQTSNPSVWNFYEFEGLTYCKGSARTAYHYVEPAISYETRPYVIRHQDIPYHHNILLEGHFQSEKYFSHCKDEIIDLFGKGWTSLSDCVSIHIRRGDYLTLAGHLPPVTIGYLTRAIEYFKDKGFRKFMVFGDDPAWN